MTAKETGSSAPLDQVLQVCTWPLKVTAYFRVEGHLLSDH